jgi:hypothetical protein
LEEYVNSIIGNTGGVDSLLELRFLKNAWFV